MWTTVHSGALRVHLLTIQHVNPLKRPRRNPVIHRNSSLSVARYAGPVEDAVVSEAIERIRNAEEEAEKLERAARAQSKTLIAGAHDAAERLVDETRKAGWAEEKTLRAAAASEAEIEAEKLVAESRSSVESVRADATQRVEAGIKKVLEVITAGAATTRG